MRALPPRPRERYNMCGCWKIDPPEKHRCRRCLIELHADTFRGRRAILRQLEPAAYDYFELRANRRHGQGAQRLAFRNIRARAGSPAASPIRALRLRARSDKCPEEPLAPPVERLNKIGTVVERAFPTSGKGGAAPRSYARRHECTDC